MTPGRPGRRLQLRLFATCWLVFVLHFATDIVREHYLSFSLAEDFSFRMDRYLGLHIDVFEVPGHGAHINNNPGVSMLGAIPYALTRPLIERITSAVNARRASSGEPATAIYNDPRPRRVEFYRRVREQGLDIKFGLAAGVIQALFIAPLSAFAAIVMLRLLAALGLSPRLSLLGALLYALGTPIFFRTAYLNQNLLIAHLTLFGFVALWRPGQIHRWSDRTAALVAGFCGGYAILADYSGVLALGWFGLYAMWRGWQDEGPRGALTRGTWVALGATGPILLLLFYQYRSFGSPWYPAQHYMVPVPGTEVGYQGVGVPSAELLRWLLFSPQFGLLVSCPLLLLSIAGLVSTLRRPTLIPRAEGLFFAGCAASIILFFSGVQYTRVEWVTGVRYVVPTVPLLFLLVMVTLVRLPPLTRFVIVVLAFAEAWSMSMVRAIDISESLARVMLGGFQLPWVNVLAKMAPQYLPFLAQQSSPLGLMALVGILIYGIWRFPERETL